MQQDFSLSLLHHSGLSFYKGEAGMAWQRPQKAAEAGTECAAVVLGGHQKRPHGLHVGPPWSRLSEVNINVKECKIPPNCQLEEVPRETQADNSFARNRNPNMAVPLALF